MEVTVLDRQTLLDMAVQTLGGVEGVFALAERNGVGITSRLTDGQTLLWEVEDIVSDKVRSIYERRGLRPATEIATAEYNSLLQGSGDIALLPPRPPRPDVTIEDGTVVSVDKIDEVIGKLEQGEAVISKSGQKLTRIFGNPYDSVFA